MEIAQLHQNFLQSSGVCTDTRKIKKGALFFALKGANFNGNLFVEQALEQGCSLAISDDQKFKHHENIIVVENVLHTLQQLANFHRHTFKKCKFLAITGSNGKTTSKELIANVLAQNFDTVFTKGNLNNHIGVPLTLLDIRTEPDFAIIEMGANHQGEIKELMEIADPDYGYITNFGLAHLEGMGGVEGVIKTKSELYDYLRANNGFAFVNASDSRMISKSEGVKRLLFGSEENSFAQAEIITSNPFLTVKIVFQSNSIQFESAMVGEYNIHNMLAAACIGFYFGVPLNKIEEGIRNYKPDNNRSQLENTSKNELLLDAYNANPSSMTFAIQSFAKMNAKFPKIVILGKMMELGVESKKHHDEIASLATQQNFEQVIVVGDDYPDFDSVTYRKFKTVSDLIEMLHKESMSNKTILIKGSRANQLEQLKSYL